jgi:hypothetical protein
MQLKKVVRSLPEGSADVRVKLRRSKKEFSRNLFVTEKLQTRIPSVKGVIVTNNVFVR